jgi:hypothetical protein
MSTPPPPPPTTGGSAAGGSASTNAIIALVAGIVSWVVCPWIGGIIAWIMGKGEINKINRGESPEAGRTMAKIGMWLGIVNVIVWTLFGMVYLAIIIFGLILSSTN